METKFTREAGKDRLYLFRLLEPTGIPRAYRVVRNGQTLEMTGELTLLINPEEVIRENAARTTVNQTPHSSFVDSFGLGLPKWTLRGTMGFGQKFSFGLVGPFAIMDGYSGFHALSDLIAEYFTENRRRAIQAATGQAFLKLLRLEFIDTWDDDSWVIEPEGLPTKRRAIQHNPIIKYDWRFTGLHDLQVRSAATQPTDAVGHGLTGGTDRQTAIAQAIEAHKEKLADDIKSLKDIERTIPGALAQLQDLMSCANTIQFSEPSSALQDRSSLWGLASTTEDGLGRALVDGKAIGPVSPSLENAIGVSMKQSRLLGGSSNCGGRVAVGTEQSLWNSTLDSIAGASSGGAGDDHILSLFSPAAVATLQNTGSSAVASLQAAAAGDLSLVPSFSTAGTYLEGLIAPVSGFGSDLLAVAQGAKGTIDTALLTVKDTVDKMRAGLATVQAALYTLRVLSTAARRLRAIKRSLNNYMCAVQSILAFPYLFVRDLREGLQAVLDLFELSGCATSFPSLGGLSWEPNIQVPRIILP